VNITEYGDETVFKYLTKMLMKGCVLMGKQNNGMKFNEASEKWW
jgi:hypothetical protein